VWFAGASLILALLAGCGPSAAEWAAVDYTPQDAGGFPVSTPEEQGLDPALVAELYYDASKLDTIYSVLVLKNGYLVAERYFNEGSVGQEVLMQSATKSTISALVGIALEQGCLTGVDQKMIEFFPDEATAIASSDPRKAEITIRQLLQMRSGYPWEESDPGLWEGLLTGDYMPLIAGYPLVSDPGARFHYSNLTAYILGAIVARACDTDLRSFAELHLLSPIGAEAGEWWQDQNGVHMPFFFSTARNMARFGQLYLDDGVYEGRQIVPARWVDDSLQVYSEDAWTIRVGGNFKDVGYGYQWWSVRAGDHRYTMAWGHGGQQIVLLDAQDLVVVVTADPLFKQHGDEPWKHERANLNLVADFIAGLP
jgi:CubicO group peptidase (beta-lactamase class C family)